MAEILHAYLHLLTDIPHLMVELTFMLIVDVFVLGMAWPLIKRWIRKHDQEHHND